jgi:hypothetical protein
MGACSPRKTRQISRTRTWRQPSTPSLCRYYFMGLVCMLRGHEPYLGREVRGRGGGVVRRRASRVLHHKPTQGVPSRGLIPRFKILPQAWRGSPRSAWPWGGKWGRPLGLLWGPARGSTPRHNGSVRDWGSARALEKEGRRTAVGSRVGAAVGPAVGAAVGACRYDHTSQHAVVPDGPVSENLDPHRGRLQRGGRSGGRRRRGRGALSSQGVQA